MNANKPEPVVTDADLTAFRRFSGQYYQTADRFDEALKQAFAAHRASAVIAERDRCVSVLRSLADSKDYEANSILFSDSQSATTLMRNATLIRQVAANLKSKE